MIKHLILYAFIPAFLVQMIFFLLFENYKFIYVILVTSSIVAVIWLLRSLAEMTNKNKQIHEDLDPNENPMEGG